jgi:hypothetical protein
VHPGLESAELEAVEPQSWQVRQTDYEFVISPEAQAIVQEEGIILVDYSSPNALERKISRIAGGRARSDSRRAASRLQPRRQPSARRRGPFPNQLPSATI